MTDFVQNLINLPSIVTFYIDFIIYVGFVGLVLVLGRVAYLH